MFTAVGGNRLQPPPRRAARQARFSTATKAASSPREDGGRQEQREHGWLRDHEISPDGRWLAYQANDTGEFEIYVQPFPDVGKGRWLVSTSGGIQPHWSRDGKELFYVAPPATMMGVAVPAGDEWRPASPKKIFEGSYFFGSASFATNNFRTYDVSLDSRRFLMIKPRDAASESASTTLIVVQGWTEE